MQENSIFFNVFRKVSFYVAGAVLAGIVSAYDHFDKFVVLELPVIAAVIALGGDVIV